MNMSIRQLFMAYKGEETTCPETIAMLNAEYPGWTLDTVVDVNEYLNHHKTHGIEKFALVAIYKNLDDAKLKQLSKWGKDLLKDTVFVDDKDKAEHDHVKKADDEMSLRYARKLLIKDSKATDTEILTKCQEVLGLV